MTHGVLPLGYSFWQALGPAIVLLILSLGLGNFKKNSLKITSKIMLRLFSVDEYDRIASFLRKVRLFKIRRRIKCQEFVM